VGNVSGVPLLTGRIDAFVAKLKGTTPNAAHAVAHATAVAWWRARVKAEGGNPTLLSPAAYCPSRQGLSSDLITVTTVLGREVAGLPVPDGVAALGRLYTHALPDKCRSDLGAHYTPPALVARLLDAAERAGHTWLTSTAIDPSCGGGAFLVEAALRISKAMCDSDPTMVLTAVSARLRGWDIDPFACWLAQLAVETALLPFVIKSSKRLPRVVECKDAVKVFEAAKGQFDLVMGNPAFGKVKKTSEMGRKFGRSLYGHPNMYGIMTDIAIHLAKPANGVIAFLTPTSFLGGDYFRNLRRTLTKEAPPVSIDIVESRRDVFNDVLQEVALGCYRRGAGNGNVDCSLVHVESGGLRIERTGTMAVPMRFEEPWILPRAAEDAALVQRLAQMPTRLRDWGYRVSTGPLVWNRHKSRLHADYALGRYPVIWAEAIAPDGRFSLQAAKSNHCDRAWFAPAKKASDPNLVRKRCVIAQRTTAKEQSRRIVCAVLPQEVIVEYGAVAVENHLNMFIPIGDSPPVPLTSLAAFLSTALADRVVRCINGSVALSASELSAMPLPSAGDLMAALTEPDIESAICRLYGIADESTAEVPPASLAA
jgi:adenine-specific DNA-methyltransferase